MTTKPRLANRTVSSDDGVGAYEDVDGAVEESGMDFAAFSGGGGSCEQPDVDSDCSGESGYDGLEVLCGKDFGWSHQACLGAVVDGYEHAQERHESFAAADVALKQTVSSGVRWPCRHGFLL